MNTGVSRLVTGLCGYEDTTMRRWRLKTRYSNDLFLYIWLFLFGFVVFVAASLLLWLIAKDRHEGSWNKVLINKIAYDCDDVSQCARYVIVLSDIS